VKQQAADFLKVHQEYGWMRGIKTQLWTLFTTGMKLNP
jgi:hypothetical protein